MKHNDYRRKVDAKYWLIPPEIYNSLNAEFHFTFDPCPYPFEKDGIEIEWGAVNWVNPPFRASDSINGHGVNDFVRKAIEENKKGKTSVLILPVPGYVTMLLKAHAEIRPVGRVKWMSAITGKLDTAPNHNALFVLRSSEHIIPRPAKDIFQSSRTINQKTPTLNEYIKTVCKPSACPKLGGPCTPMESSMRACIARGGPPALMKAEGGLNVRL